MELSKRINQNLDLALLIAGNGNGEDANVCFHLCLYKTLDDCINCGGELLMKLKSLMSFTVFGILTSFLNIFFKRDRIILVKQMKRSIFAVDSI